MRTILIWLSATLFTAIAEAVEAVLMSTPEFAQYIERETVKWARVVKEAGIKAD